MLKQQKKTAKAATTVYFKTLFALLLIGITFASCQDDDLSSPSDLSNDISNQTYVNILENRLAELPNNAQVAIALVQNGNTEYLGVTKENDILKSTNNAEKVFEIGSIIKVFTGICLSQMIAENEATLTETLDSQFDFTLQAGGDITLEQLANHTSGLPRLPTNVDEVQGFNIEDPYAVYTHENLQSYLENQVVLNAESGTAYEYSNLGMGILGYVLAQKRDDSIEELMQEIIFEPLGMSNSTTLLENVDAADLVEPRDINGSIVSHWNFSETTSAAGSAKSTVTDMVKFLQKNFTDDAVYNLPQQKTFDQGSNLHSGLGWGIYEENNFSLLLHDGGTGGFSSILILDKEKEIGVIALSNVEDFHGSITPMANDFILEMAE